MSTLATKIRTAPWLRTWFATLILLIVAYGVVPYLGNTYLLEAILTPFLALSLAAVGLNLLTGYAGQLSLGTAAFMAAGAYAAYNFNLRLPGLPLTISLLLAGVCAAAIGILFGFTLSKVIASVAGWSTVVTTSSIVVAFGVGAGLRPGELAGLRGSDVARRDPALGHW